MGLDQPVDETAFQVCVFCKCTLLTPRFIPDHGTDSEPPRAGTHAGREKLCSPPCYVIATGNGGATVRSIDRAPKVPGRQGPGLLASSTFVVACNQSFDI